MKWEKKRLPVIAFGTCLALLLSVSPFASGMTALAAEEQASTSLYQAADGGQISAERLADKKIEYEELGSLIHEKNTLVKNVASILENQKRSYRAVRDSIRWEEQDAEWQQEEAQKENDTGRYAEYAGYEMIYESAVKSYNQILKNLNKASANQSRLTLEKQLTSAAQSLFISWQSAASQEEYLEKMEELLEESWRNTCLRQEAGMATGDDVLAAYHNWQSASDARSSVTSAKETVYQNLCVLLGTETDGSVELVPLTGTDLNRLEELSLEEETREALINHTGLSNTRKTSAATTAEKTKKARTVKEKQEEVTLDMKALYSQLKQAKLSYDAAQASFEAGQIAWSNAQSKQAMGMLSKEEYLQEEMQYLQKKAAFESADLTLLQALESYQWAARGI